MFRLVLSILLALGAAVPSHATRYYVDAGATGSATGLSWANAFTGLQEALSVVIPGDEIWVAAGQYKPTTGTNRTIAFNLRNGVDVYGSFAGTETHPDERDIAGNPTVLNGDIGEPGTSGDNSRSVVKAANINTAIILDGFRIMNGYSQSGSSYDGGGLNVQHTLNGNLLVRNCTFVNNYSGTYGGAIYMAAANLTLERCEFNSNSAGTGGDGGAIYNGNNNGGYSTLEVRDCVFKNNTARRGASIHGGLDFDQLFIDRCIFTNNTSPLSIFEVDGFAGAVVRNSYFIGNTVNGSTSNIFRVQASLASEVLTMANCTFTQNYNLYASPGSEMIRVYGTHHRIVNSIVYGNTPYAGRQVSTGMGISSSIVQGGHGGGTAIIDADPLFTAPHTGAPGNFDATLYDYTVQPGSPAVNAGENALVNPSSVLDLAGAPRIQGGTVDLGCYESDGTVSVPEPMWPGPWYYDAGNQELHLAFSGAGVQGTVEVFTLDGRLLLRTYARSGILPLNLRPGLYVARAAGHAPLRFMVP